MAKNSRVSLSDRLKSNPMNELFKSTEEAPPAAVPEAQPERTHSADPELEGVLQPCRKTYILTEELSKAVGIYASMTGMDKSEIVRNAIAQYVPAEYLEMAKKSK